MRSVRQFVAVSLLGIFSLTAYADLQVGQAAPELDTVLIDGSVLTARQTEGKVVARLFWATWCHFCVSELPGLQKLHDTYKSRGLEIIAISLDRDADDVREFWRGNGYTFPVAMRSDGIRRVYGGIVGTPTLFLVDRKGIVRLKHIGYMTDAELAEQIKSLL